MYLDSNYQKGNSPTLQPTVIWRSRDRERSESPVQRTAVKRCGKKVSLLSDWREKFDITTRAPDLNERRHEYFDFKKPSITTAAELNGFSDDVDSALEVPQLVKTDEKHFATPIENSEFPIRESPFSQDQAT